MCSICGDSGWTETGPCRHCDGPQYQTSECEQCARLRAELAEAREVVGYLENCLRGWASVGAVSGCTFGSIRVPKSYLEKAATRARAFIDRGRDA